MDNATKKTITETVQEHFNFEVIKLPLHGPDNSPTGLYALFRDDNGTCISKQSVTKRYVPHKTDDVTALAEAAEEVFEDIEVRCNFSTGHYLDVKPTNEARKAVYGTEDDIFPRLLINASYDGRAFSAQLGYWRDLCLNMSMLRQVKGTNSRIRHSSNLRNNMNELIDNFSMLKESWADLSTFVDRMEATDVLLDSFLDRVYGTPPESGRGLTQHKNRTTAIVSRLLREHTKSNRPELDPNAPLKVTGWQAFNAVQGYVQHEATRKGSPTDLDRIIAATEDAAVARAEKLITEISIAQGN